MEQLARVTRAITKNYVSIVLKTGQGPCPSGCEHCPEKVCPALKDYDDSGIAEDFFDTRYGDIVIVKQREALKDRRTLPAYLLPPVMIFLGCYIGIKKAWSLPDCILSGIILGIIAFGVSWIINRRARLRGRLRFEIVRVLKRYSEY